MEARREAHREEAKAIRGQFAPHRLRMARELVDLSQGDLGVEIGVSAAAVSQYERGAAIPTGDSIVAFARRLAVPVEFFSVPDTGADTPAFFRSLRSAPAVERKRARHLTQLIHEVARDLERDVRLPSIDVPRHPVDPEAGKAGAVLAARAARAVREDWAISPGPIDNMVRQVERHGIVVARPQSGHARIDAFSVPFSDRPVIVMSAVKGKRDRSRFDVAHELGHLVMHEPDQSTTRQIEKQADAFAAEFLMPAADIREELPNGLDWSRFMSLKQRWQVSIQALLYRARELQRLDEGDYVRAMKAMSARGWRRHEPGDLGDPESPVMLDRAIEVARLSEDQLTQRTAMPLTLLRDVLDSAADRRPEVLI